MVIAFDMVLFGSGWLTSNTNAESQQLQTAPTPIAGKAIMLENAHQGTTDWEIPAGKEASTQIQAYAGATSVSPGHEIAFYVSTQTEKISYSINIYRLGWYGGTGGRLMFVKTDLVGQAQGYSDPDTHKLIHCSSCNVNTKTGLIEANWQPSYTLTIPTNWTTGVYLAKFIDARGLQTYAPFDVLGNFHSLYVVVTPDATYQAYNIWGGYDLYASGEDTNSVSSQAESISLPKAVNVSFNRPYAQEDGSAQILVFEADAIRWFERQGYDLSYISDIDLSENPAQLLNHRTYISMGHDEYWTKQIRDGLEQARNNGVGLAFLGANVGFWQIRLEPDSSGIADRTIVCYKVESASHDLASDPYYTKDKSLLTAEWRDPIIGRPENSLVGIMYEVGDWGADNAHYPPWQLSSQANSPLLSGTGLEPGQQYGCDLIGYEWDSVVENGKSPAGLQILGTTHTMDQGKVAGFSNSAYYIAFSGAMVFATGSIFWSYALDNYRLHPDTLCSQQNLVVPGMQKLMANVMAALIVLHPSGQLSLISTIHNTYDPAGAYSGMVGLVDERRYRHYA